MKTLVPASLGTLVLAGSLLVGPARALRAEDNGGGDDPITGDCPTWKTCDQRCGDSPPLLDGSPEADAAYDEYLECTNRCLREVFDCITQQARLPETGGVLDPDPDPELPDLVRAPVILPEILDLEQPMVYLEPGQSVSSADTNGDGSVDLSDAMRIFNFLFSGGEEPGTIMIGGYVLTETSPQLSSDGLRLIIDGNLVLTSGDTDASGKLDIVDPMRILNFLFSGGKEPVEIWTRPLRRPPDDRLPPDLEDLDPVDPDLPIDRLPRHLPPIDVIVH